MEIRSILDHINRNNLNSRIYNRFTQKVSNINIGNAGGNTSISTIRQVTITITNKKNGVYEARSYPHDDINSNGKIELYEVDVYDIIINGKDDNGIPQTFKHIAPRFMPYYNNRKKPNHEYKQLGWVNAGLSSARKITISRYNKNYEVHNRYSPGRGAIVLQGSFYLHAGPADRLDVGFGSAGCIEIIGNFDVFKSNIKFLSGSKFPTSDEAIEELVKTRNLIVIIEQAKVPDIKSNFTKEI